VVFYLLDAFRLFRVKLVKEIKGITFEIGILRWHGLDPENVKLVKI